MRRPSARKAAQVIASVNQDLQKTVTELDGMSEAQRGALFGEHAEQLQKAQMRLATSMQALAAKPELLSIISEEMKKMPMVKNTAKKRAR